MTIAAGLVAEDETVLAPGVKTLRHHDKPGGRCSAEMARARCVETQRVWSAARNLAGLLPSLPCNVHPGTRTPATTGGSDAITQPPSFSDTYDFLCVVRSCHLLCQSVCRRTDNYCPAPSSSDLPHHPPHADPPLHLSRARRLSSQSPRLQSNLKRSRTNSRMLSGIRRVYRGLSSRRLMAEFGHSATAYCIVRSYACSGCTSTRPISTAVCRESASGSGEQARSWGAAPISFRSGAGMLFRSTGGVEVIRTEA